MKEELPSLEEAARQLAALRLDADLTCYVHGPRNKLKKLPSVLRKHGRKGGFGADPDFDPEAWEDFAGELEEELEDLESVDTVALELEQIADLEAALVIAQALPELEIAAAAELCGDGMELKEYAWFSPAGSRLLVPIQGGTDYLLDAAVYPPYSCRPEEWDWGFPPAVRAWSPFEVPCREFFQQWREALEGMSEEDYLAYCHQ